MPRQLLDDCRDICEAAALKCIAEASGNSAEVAEYDNQLNQLLRKLQADTNQFSNAVNNNQPRYSAPSVVPSFNYNQRTNPGATQSLPALPPSTVGPWANPGRPGNSGGSQWKDPCPGSPRCNELVPAR